MSVPEKAAPAQMQGAPVAEYQFNAKKFLIFLCAVVVMLTIYYLPGPPALYNGEEQITLTTEGKATIAALIFAVILWLTEAIPFSATALSLMVILHVMGVADFKHLVQVGLGSHVIIFLLGAIGLSAALTSSGFANRFMLFLISRVGVKTDRILLAFLLAGTIASMWVTNMAVAAMLLPLAVNILNMAGCKPLESNFGRGLLISIAWSALAGGIGTPAGNGANVLALGFLRDIAHINVTFGQWMIVGVPASIIMCFVCWRVLLLLFPPEINELPVKQEQIKQMYVELGNLRRKEINVLIIFVVTVILWLFGPQIGSVIGMNIPTAFVALLAFVLCFIPGLQVFDSWKEAQNKIDWAGLILIAGGISAGLMLAETEAARYVAWGLLRGIGSLHPIMAIIVVVGAIELMKIFFSSNSVTGAVVIPLIAVLAVDLNIDPWTIAGPAGIATSMGFIMVTSSPTNVLPYSAGYFTIAEFAKSGIIMTVLGILIVALSVAVFGEFAGMNVW